MTKLKKLSFGCHFGRKRRGKAGEISVKFENLEKKKLSKWTRLFPVDGLKSKIMDFKNPGRPQHSCAK